MERVLFLPLQQEINLDKLQIKVFSEQTTNPQNGEKQAPAGKTRTLEFDYLARVLPQTV